MPGHGIFCDCWECEVKAYEKLIERLDRQKAEYQARIEKLRKENVPG